MKKIVALLLLSFSVQAGLTLDWEINLVDKINEEENSNYVSGGFETPYKLNNGDMLTSGSVSEHPDGSQNKVYKQLVIDKDTGNIKHIFNEVVDRLYFLDFFNDGDFYYHRGFNGSTYGWIIFCYVDDNGSYTNETVTNLSMKSDYRQSVNSSIPHQFTYAISMTNSQIAYKYTITSDNPTPTLSAQTSSGFNQDNYVINWDSSSGAQYQIQSSTDLTNWVDVGSALIGTGDMMTWANHVTNSQAFYRYEKIIPYFIYDESICFCNRVANITRYFP